MLTLKQNLRILDFDIETLPLSYWADRPTAEITAIASCWTDDMTSMKVSVLGPQQPYEILSDFVERYNQADIVTGHYIRRFDLPMINGALMEYSHLGFKPLAPKLAQDTKMDMHKKGDIPATQEYLSELLGIPIDKYQMTQHKWRSANRLTEAGIQEATNRCSQDVYQHMFLRLQMTHLGLLKAPKVWRP
jgi:hypothetical protein